jgi:ferredoxin
VPRFYSETKRSQRTSISRRRHGRPAEEIDFDFHFGRKYKVPEGLTIQKAMEYSGYQFIRSCGCRGGICGACVTEYRVPGTYQLKVALACQTLIEPEMQITQSPFVPMNRASYALEQLKNQP